MMFGLLDYVMSFIHTRGLPLEHLKYWRPIKIDALGLVTLLGADDVNRNVGTLQRRRFTECLPFLAAFVIAGDNFTDAQPGYALYNITDGIYTTELKGWFTRWLSAQRIHTGTTVFHWSILEESHHFDQVQYIAWAIGFLAVAPLFVCTCLSGDWYGVGNTLAIILCIIVRKFLLWQLRNGLNSAVVPKQSEALPLHSVDSEKTIPSTDTASKIHSGSSAAEPIQTVTLFVTRADGKFVTIYCPRKVLSTFVRPTELPNPSLYHFMRWVGWTAFGTHIIVLGMSSLFTQIYTVVLLVFSTWALCHDFALDSGRERGPDSCMADGTTCETITTRFTSRLQVRHEIPKDPGERRMYAFARAQPTEQQELMMQHWSLLPFPNVQWYDEYYRIKSQFGQLEPLSRPDSTSTAPMSLSTTGPGASAPST